MMLWERSRRNWVLGEGSSSGSQSASRSNLIFSNRLGGLVAAPRPRGDFGLPVTLIVGVGLPQSGAGRLSVPGLPLRRQERKPRPPPDDLAALVSEPKRRSHLLDCAAHCRHYLLAVPGRGGGSLEIPLQVRLFVWLQFGTLNGQARVSNQPFPGLAREIAAMARVAQLLHVMQPFLCRRVVVRHAPVNQ